MNFGCADMVKRNTVPMPAISQIDSGQVNILTEFQRILAYQSAMAQARAMRKRGLINDDELLKIEELFAKKYSFNFGDIHRDMDLINLVSRGNMPYYEGGV